MHENILHMLLTLGAKNSRLSEYKKTTKWPKIKNHFPCSPFRMDYIAFKIFVSYIIQSNALYEHCQT